jgi:WD40 repeat protein
VWESKTGEVLHTIHGHVGPVRSVAVSPDGTLLFSGGADGKIRVWSPTTGELLNILLGHPRGVSAIAISPDSRYLASGGLDHSIKIFHRRPTPEPATERPSEHDVPPSSGSLPPRPDFLPDESPRYKEPSRPQDLPD